MKRIAPHGGFTLVELLVVVGIIALLMGVLLPLLSVARASSRATACLARQREVGAASLLRAQAHDGYLQPMGMIELPVTFVDGDDLARAIGDSVRKRYAYSSWGNLITGTRETLVPYSRDLANYLQDKAGTVLFHCPAEPGDAPVQFVLFRVGDTAIHLADPEPSDFAANEGVFGISLTPNDPWRRRGKIAQIQESARIVLFADARSAPATSPFVWSPVGTATAPVTLADCARQPQEAARVNRSAVPGGRHRGATNVLFADGHALALQASQLDEALLLP